MNILLRRKKLGHGSCTGIQQSSNTGLTMVRNDRGWLQDVQYVFRWGCTSLVPDGVTVVNSAESIKWCSDKRQGRLDMQAAGVNVPRTCVDFSAVEDYPVVVRPTHHAQGRHLYVAHTDVELQVILQTHFLTNQNGFYISTLIDKEAEYRVAVIQGRVAWVAQKTPGNPEDVAWNVARGGSFRNVKWSEWPMLVVKEALKAAKVSGTDFCGVDVMTDIAGTPYVLEINSAPSQTSPYRQKCFAKCFDYIVEHGKDHFPDVSWSAKTSFRSTIHPALKTG